MPGMTSAPSASISRTALPVDGADLDDDAVAHGDVGGPGVGAGPVDDGTAADDQVVVSHAQVSHRRLSRRDLEPVTPAMSEGPRLRSVRSSLAVVR